MKCTKCNGEMEEGLISDKSSNINTPFEQEWGTKLKNGLLLRSIENSHTVKTFRCKECGYLESYAKE